MIGHSLGGAAGIEAVACVQCITEGCSPGVEGSCGPAVIDDRPRLCLTATTDTAREPTYKAYEASLGPAFIAEWGDGANHLTPLFSGLDSPAGAQYLRLYAAWFRCFLADDEAGCALFRGDSECPVCADDGWVAIEGKRIP